MRFTRAAGGGRGKIHMSVREFVEFARKEGGLDDRVSARSAQEAMLLGARLHRKIQRSMGPDYQSEVPFSCLIERTGYDLLVEGRADGVIRSQSDDGSAQVLIDEIKGVYLDLEDLSAPLEVHRAQAACYAYMLCRQEELPAADIRLTYIHMESEEIRYFREHFTFSELQAYFDSLCGVHFPFLDHYADWILRRDGSMDALSFPFPYRTGQRSLVAGVYQTIRGHKKLYLMAPTGVGKTMAVLYPGIRAVGSGEADRIFYLTARTVGAAAPENAYEILRSCGLLFRTVRLTAKEKICFLNTPSCNPDDCPYADKYFEKYKEALYCLLTGDETSFSMENIRRAASQFSVCPYELSLDLALWMDGVICDYNYIFDPDARLGRMFPERAEGRDLFFIDEAHHLVGRARDMYSAVLIKEDVLAARRKLKDRDKKSYKALGLINSKMLSLKKGSDDGGRIRYTMLQDDSGLAAACVRALAELDRLFEESKDVKLKEELLDFYFSLRAYVNTSERFCERYVLYTYENEDGHFAVKQYCTDPSDHIRECLRSSAGTVLFSATFLPIRYFREMLGADEEDPAIYAPSPFDPRKRLVLTARDVSARYNRRGEEEYRRIASYIHLCAKAKKGNYIAYFPSYKMMDEVFRIYKAEFDEPGISWVTQSRYMGEEEREIFLENFEYAGDETMIGFCVMGGLFAEGIDLAGDRLIGAIIVGTGLPQIGAEGDVLKDAFDARGENGFDYAYRYPGMNKVLQAGGRVIRTAEDRGVVLLLDDRFTQPSYSELFPREWTPRLACTLETAGDIISAFWQQTEE